MLTWYHFSKRFLWINTFLTFISSLVQKKFRTCRGLTRILQRKRPLRKLRNGDDDSKDAVMKMMTAKIQKWHWWWQTHRNDNDDHHNVEIFKRWSVVLFMYLFLQLIIYLKIETKGLNLEKRSLLKVLKWRKDIVNKTFTGKLRIFAYEGVFFKLEKPANTVKYFARSFYVQETSEIEASLAPSCRNLVRSLK